MSQSTSALHYSFQGKKILITGGGQGVGLELVSRLYKDGAQVFTIEKNPALVEKLRKDFPKITAEVADVSNWNETQKIVESFGPLDHLVNNAGIAVAQGLLEVTEDKVDLLMDINIKGVICITQAVAKGMIAGETKGTIVNVASIASYITAHGSGVYGATKAAVKMFTKAAANELGKHGIRCNSVSPTYIDTPMFHLTPRAKATPEDDKKRYFTRQPLAGKFVLTPAEVVDTILYYLSPLSSMATGTDIPLEGGALTC